MESIQVACQKHWVLKLVLSKQCTWRRCCGNLETPLVRKLLIFFTCQHIAAFGHGHCMIWPFILVLHGPCPWHGRQFHWSWCHWSWCPWSGAWSWPPCSWRPWPTKTWANFHEGSMVCHIWCKWLCHGFCCTISMMGTQWHCNVVPIDGSLAHTTWTSLWLLVVLAYGRLRGAPMHPSWSMHLGLELHGLAPGLLALGVLLLAKHFPWLSVLVVGMVLESTQKCWLGTKIGFCETSFAT